MAEYVVHSPFQPSSITRNRNLGDENVQLNPISTTPNPGDNKRGTYVVNVPLKPITRKPNSGDEKRADDTQMQEVCCDFRETLQRLIHDRDREDFSEVKNRNLDAIDDSMFHKIVDYLIVNITCKRETPDNVHLFNEFFKLKEKDFELIVMRSIKNVQSKIRIDPRVDMFDQRFIELLVFRLSILRLMVLDVFNENKHKPPCSEPNNQVLRDFVNNVTVDAKMNTNFLL